jgi:hypothetical protein
VGVRRSLDQTVTFSEPVTGISTGTASVNVILRNGAGTRIPATVSLIGNTGVRVNPSANLVANTVYRITLNPTALPLTSSIRDVANARLAQRVITFTTGANL